MATLEHVKGCTFRSADHLAYRACAPKNVLVGIGTAIAGASAGDFFTNSFHDGLRDCGRAATKPDEPFVEGSPAKGRKPCQGLSGARLGEIGLAPAAISGADASSALPLRRQTSPFIYDDVTDVKKNIRTTRTWRTAMPNYN